MKKILITGFEPFNGESTNPSEIAVNSLEETDDSVLCKMILPVSFHRATCLVSEAISSISPDAVLLTGQAGGRNGITVEKVALNLWDSAMPDNEQFIPASLIPNLYGPAAYFSTANTAGIIRRLKEHGIHASQSLSAGSFVCNAVYFAALQCINKMPKSIPCVFLHLPFLPQQKSRKNAPFMSLADMITALHITTAFLTDRV